MKSPGNPSRLRAGVIGTGFIGLVHMEALRRLGVQVTALCDLPDRVEAAAARLGIRREGLVRFGSCKPRGGVSSWTGMPPNAIRFIQSWFINTLAVLAAVILVDGIRFKDNSFWTPFVTSLILGILNAFFRPVMMFLALPLLVVTLGLFMLVINALLLYLVGLLLGSYFEVDGFGSALLGALIISTVSLVLNTLTGVNRSRLRIEHRRTPHKPRHDDGPYIDI